MIIPGPQLAHQLNASTTTTSEDDNFFVPSQSEMEKIQDQSDEQSSSSLLGKNYIDNRIVRPRAIHEDATITQQGIKLRMSPIYYGTSLIIDLGFLGLILYRFQMNRSCTLEYCSSNSMWAMSSCSDIIASIILLLLVGVNLFLLHKPFISASANLSLAQDKSDLSKPKYDTTSNFNKYILSALGSIHAPFPSQLYNDESLLYSDDNASSNSAGITGTNAWFHKVNYSQIESCRQLVEAIVQLVVHIDSAIQALQMATGLQLGIGITSLAIFKVEQSFLNRLANGNLQPSLRRDSICVERLKQNLFRIMVDTINQIENVNVLLQGKINKETASISDQSSTIRHINELNRVVEKSGSTPLSLSLLKSCRRQVALSLSSFTTYFLLSKELESSSCSVSIKIRNLIQLATDGTEYLYNALFPYASSTSQQQNGITSQAPCRRRDCAKSAIFPLIIKLDAARTLLWCIQQNYSTEIYQTTINEKDGDSSMFPEFTHPDIERLLQSQKLMAEALSLTNCLLERKRKGNLQNKRHCKETIDYSTTSNSLEHTEAELLGSKMHVFEAGCLSQESDRISTDSTTNKQSATLVYSGRGEHYFNCQPSSSVREPNRTRITSSSADEETKVKVPEDTIIITPEDAANSFIGELQNRLLELGLPEEGQKTNAAKEDADSNTSSSISVGNISPRLPLTATSNLFIELKELHKLMLDKGDLIPQESC